MAGKFEGFELKGSHLDHENDIFGKSESERKKLGAAISYLDDCKPIADQLDMEEIIKLREWIEGEHKIKIGVITQKVEDSQYTIDPIQGLSEQRAKLEKLKKELIKSPPGFLHKMGVRKIILTGGLVGHYLEDGKKKDQPVNASAQLWDGTLYMDKIWPLFHEGFHIMDGIVGGNDPDKYGVPLDIGLWQEHLSAQKQNRKWAELGWDKATIEKNKGIEITANIDEEQAEYCRILFNIDRDIIYETQYKKKMAKPGGPAKFAQMKKWLYEWSDGQIDEQYWQDLRAGKVDEQYWRKRGTN